MQLLKAENCHEEFRLWITAEPHPNFPIGLLHMGLKLTNEAPVGIRAGLQASFSWLSQVSCTLILSFYNIPDQSIETEILEGSFCESMILQSQAKADTQTEDGTDEPVYIRIYKSQSLQL